MIPPSVSGRGDPEVLRLHKQVRACACWLVGQALFVVGRRCRRCRRR